MTYESMSLFNKESIYKTVFDENIQLIKENQNDPCINHALWLRKFAKKQKKLEILVENLNFELISYNGYKAVLSKNFLLKLLIKITENRLATSNSSTNKLRAASAQQRQGTRIP